ncbi:Coiled-coil domain-containing protein [Trichinella pseudospiralis]|uniref:Coiled-coil domain-containing protein n=1 Tax=Trichinella pseudospiralis TaxID=6337 RepID=A0A0V1KBN1_TRIPS|nr:Coiled-coil domain-containing protein [Trichinella pseudospiralis]
MPIHGVKDFKNRVTSIIGSSKHIIASDGDSSKELQLNKSEDLSNKERKVEYISSVQDEQILSSITEFYYLPSVDVIDHELKKLPPVLDINEINADRRKIREQLSVVSKKISELILSYHPSYSAELVKVGELKASVEQLHSVCQTARKCIREANQESTIHCLNVLNLYRKRQHLLNVFVFVDLMYSLLRTEKRVLEVADEGNFYLAIQLCQDALKAAKMYVGCKAVEDMCKNFEETTTIIEAKLINSGIKAAFAVDMQVYGQIIAVCELHGNTRSFLQHLITDFNYAIDNTSVEVLQRFQAVLSKESDENDDLRQLAKTIRLHEYSTCIKELLRLLWQIIYCYHNVVWWHEEHSTVQELLNSDNGEENFLNKEIEQLWLKATFKVATVIQHSNFRNLDFKDFVQVLQLTHRFLDFAEKYVKNAAVDLNEVVNEKSIAYFAALHPYCIEQLGLYVQTDAWEAVPVEHLFKWSSLPEFSVFSKVYESNCSVAEEDCDKRKLTARMEPHTVNPFEHLNDDSNITKTDVSMHTSLHTDEVNSANAVAEHTFSTDHSEVLICPSVDDMDPILSNSALMLLRYIGRYLQICCVNSSLSSTVTSALVELFNYYLITVCKIFLHPLMHNKRMLSRISHCLISQVESTLDRDAERFPISANNSVISDELSSSENMFGLAKRVVCAESVIFVAKQLSEMMPAIVRLLPPDQRTLLENFNSKTLEIVCEMRAEICQIPCFEAFDFAAIEKAIANVNWEIGELMSQHSAYVDDIVLALGCFNRRLADVHLKQKIPKEFHTVLWQLCAKFLFDCLIERCNFAFFLKKKIIYIIFANISKISSYSNVKKSSGEGRALMQLDFQQLLLCIERLCGARLVNEKKIVENYIKAYYIPESAIEQWIMNSRNVYTNKQLISVLNASKHISRKMRQHLIDLLLMDSVGSEH